MKKTLIAFISIVVSGALLWQCERAVTPVPSAMKKELSRLPEAAAGMAYMNVWQIKRSQFFAKFKENLERELLEEENYRDFSDAAGFDLTKDIAEAYVVFAPGKSQDDKEFLAVIKGNFDEDRIIDFIQSQEKPHKITSRRYQDYTIYQVEDKPVRFAFPDETTLIVGVEHYVTNWLNGDAGSQKWIQRMQRMRYKDGICLTMDARAMINEFLKEINQWDKEKKLQALKSVEDVYMSMRADDEIRFEGKGKFSDAQNAELFHDAIKGMIATVKISVSGDREAVDVFNKIKIDRDGDWVTGKFRMSQQDIDKLTSKRREEIAL